MTPAKLLLFGEHTVLHGGEALAVPLRKFGATWAPEGSADAGEPFGAWAAFAKTEGRLADWFDADAFAREAPGLAVRSDIPRDYGLGSSGALTAMVYERYVRSDRATDDVSELRARLGLLEGFFHGRSSGLDPLVCFLQSPVHVLADGSAQALDDAVDLRGWFLLDARQPKAGRAAIARFGESCKDDGFRQNYLRPARALTAALIADVTRLGVLNQTAFRQNLRQLSALQLEHLGWLIPVHVQQRWRTLLAEERAYLKLCGAGGGGNFLGYAHQPHEVQKPVLWL